MLYTNGCSFVWGDELPGFADDPNPTHWEHTFTHKLAEKLGVEYLNDGRCGSGNEKIFRDTVSALSGISMKEKPSHVVIMWSAPKRIELFEPRPEGVDKTLKVQRWQAMSQFSPERCMNLDTKNRDIAEMWINMVYNDQTGIIKLLTYMNAIQTLCDGMNIPVLQTIFHSRVAYAIAYSFTHPKRYEPRFAKWVIEHLESLRPECSLGIRYIDFFKELEELPLEERQDKFIDVWEDVLHIPTEDGTSKAMYDENNWVDMWTMGFYGGKYHKHLAEIHNNSHPRRLGRGPHRIKEHGNPLEIPEDYDASIDEMAKTIEGYEGCKTLDYGHPNEVCHTLMSERLYEKFQEISK